MLPAAGANAPAPSLKPACPPSLLLVKGAASPCSSPHRGSSKPRRSVTSHPSSSRTHLVRPSTPFTLGPPFHALVLTVDQLESCSRPLHAALKSKCSPSAKDLNQLESAHTFTLPHIDTHTLICHGTIIFEIQGYWVFLHFLPCIPSPICNHDHIFTTFFCGCVHMYMFLCCVFCKLITEMFLTVDGID